MGFSSHQGGCGGWARGVDAATWCWFRGAGFVVAAGDGQGNWDGGEDGLMVDAPQDPGGSRTWFPGPRGDPPWMEMKMDRWLMSPGGSSGSHPPPPHPPNLLSTTRTPQLSRPGSINFFFPTIYSLSPLQQVTSSSPGLNSPRPTYLKDHLVDTRGLLPVGLPPPSAPPTRCNDGFTHFSAASALLLLCLQGVRAKKITWGTRGMQEIRDLGAK